MVISVVPRLILKIPEYGKRLKAVQSRLRDIETTLKDLEAEKIKLS